jgi:hypothetical protein
MIENKHGICRGEKMSKPPAISVKIGATHEIVAAQTDKFALFID